MRGVTMIIFSKRKHPMKMGDSGQSTVEYLIVTLVFMAALIFPASVYDIVSTTLKNKFHSYAFGVAISDPPHKKFDDRLKHGAEEVEKVKEAFEEVEDLMEGKNFPAAFKAKLPSLGEIPIGDLVDELKSAK